MFQWTFWQVCTEKDCLHSTRRHPLSRTNGRHSRKFDVNSPWEDWSTGEECSNERWKWNIALLLLPETADCHFERSQQYFPLLIPSLTICLLQFEKLDNAACMKSVLNNRFPRSQFLINIFRSNIHRETIHLLKFINSSRTIAFWTPQRDKHVTFTHIFRVFRGNNFCNSKADTTNKLRKSWYSCSVCMVNLDGSFFTRADFIWDHQSSCRCQRQFSPWPVLSHRFNPRNGIIQWSS